MSLILTCPECATRYVAKTEGFDPPGRNVRCSRCDHMWFQEVSEPESYETLYELYEGEEASAPHADDHASSNARHERFERNSAGRDDRVTRGEDSNTESGLKRSFSASRRRFGERNQSVADASLKAEREHAGLSFRRSSGSEKSRLLSGLMGLFLTVAILGSLVASLWIFKPQITRAVPSLAGVYSALPVPARSSQFEFRNTAYSRGFEDGKSVLIVSGVLVNTTDDLLIMPAIRATLRDGLGEDMDEWVFTPRGGDIESGESRYFESRRLNPPDDAYGLNLHVIEEG